MSDIDILELKKIGFELELYKSFYDMIKQIIQNDYKFKKSAKIDFIKGQIKVTDELYNNFNNRAKENKDETSMSKRI